MKETTNKWLSEKYSSPCNACLIALDPADLYFILEKIKIVKCSRAGHIFLLKKITII